MVSSVSVKSSLSKAPANAAIPSPMPATPAPMPAPIAMPSPTTQSAIVELVIDSPSPLRFAARYPPPRRLHVPLSRPDDQGLTDHWLLMLDHVRQLMGQERTAAASAGRVLSVTKYDVATNTVYACAFTASADSAARASVCTRTPLKS